MNTICVSVGTLLLVIMAGAGIGSRLRNRPPLPPHLNRAWGRPWRNH